MDISSLGENYSEATSFAKNLEKKINGLSPKELIQFLKNFIDSKKICGAQHEYQDRTVDILNYGAEHCPHNSFNMGYCHPNYTGLSFAIIRGISIIDSSLDKRNQWFDFVERLGAIDIATRTNTKAQTFELQKNIHKDIAEFLNKLILELEKQVGASL